MGLLHGGTMIERDELSAVIARELALVDDPDRREALRSILVDPRREEREWDYGAPGQRHSYWVVADASERGTILVYCQEGFGPEFPWGFLDTDGPRADSLGMDSQWCWYLEEAFVRSGLWTGSVKPDFDEPFHMSPEERFGGGTATGA